MTYNTRSPAVKRLMKEAQELSEPTELYFAKPLEDNLFEWHFTIRGPEETDYDGGLYHGRIVLPPDYPMKPPNILLMTPSGRFEINRKICLSISGYHPETWRPSWSIRTALLAIIGFMPTHGVGAIGSLDYPPEERRKLARSSVDFVCSKCGPVRGVLRSVTEASEDASKEARSLAQQISFTAPVQSANNKPLQIKAGEEIEIEFSPASKTENNTLNLATNTNATSEQLASGMMLPTLSNESFMPLSFDEWLKKRDNVDSNCIVKESADSTGTVLTTTATTINSDNGDYQEVGNSDAVIGSSGTKDQENTTKPSVTETKVTTRQDAINREDPAVAAVTTSISGQHISITGVNSLQHRQGMLFRLIVVVIAILGLLLGTRLHTLTGTGEGDPAIGGGGGGGED